MSGTTEDNFYVFTNLGKCYKTAMESFTEETEGEIATKLSYRIMNILWLYIILLNKLKMCIL